MTTSLATRLDDLNRWRSALDERWVEFSSFLIEHELSDALTAERVATLRQRLANDKLVVAFVAEFSRGKSELINAIFFADTGRRVLPATPGRTTMCPVEIGHEADQPAALALLPIKTRLAGRSVAELRADPGAWTHVPLEHRAAEQLAEALLEVTRTLRVPQDEARALGFWDDAQPDDNPPIDADGAVEIPAWRHALINYPHPLLERGLVVLDTPGLNALGAEPELTLSLLPSAHATLFILGADTGVTKSDMAIWRDHLAPGAQSRFVVLNKIDGLRDPLLAPAEVDAQIETQRKATAVTLDVPPQRVFPLSARDALSARIDGNSRALQDSRLPALEHALGAQLLGSRHEILRQLVEDAALQLHHQAARRLGERKRQLAEQMLELRGLRGKSSARVRTLLQRVDAETAEFEQCTVRLHAVRSVHSRLLVEALNGLSSDRLRDEVMQMQQAMHASLLNLGAKRAFTALCERLRKHLSLAQARGSDIHAMLSASFTRLNAEFGFGLALAAGPALDRFTRDLELIERNYVQYLGLTQALRLSNPTFMEQFQRMLLSKLRVVFETACSELELWSKTARAQVDSQLRERRRNFMRRHEAMKRVQSAAGELEQRIAELEAQDANQQQLLARLGELAEVLRRQGQAEPGAGLAGRPKPRPAAASAPRKRARA